MAYSRNTIDTHIDSAKRITQGKALYVDNDTSGTLKTGLHKVDFVWHPNLVDFSNAAGVITLTFLDPGAGTTCTGWMAIGL